MTLPRLILCERMCAVLPVSGRWARHSACERGEYNVYVEAHLPAFFLTLHLCEVSRRDNIYFGVRLFGMQRIHNTALRFGKSY